MYVFECGFTSKTPGKATLGLGVTQQIPALKRTSFSRETVKAL